MVWAVWPCLRVPSGASLHRLPVRSSLGRTEWEGDNWPSKKPVSRPGRWPQAPGFTSGSLGGFPVGSDGKESACNAGNLSLVPGLGRSPGEGNGSPLQYSCLENPMERGAWRATVCGVAKSQTRLSQFHATLHLVKVVEAASNEKVARDGQSPSSLGGSLMAWSLTVGAPKANSTPQGESSLSPT